MKKYGPIVKDALILVAFSSVFAVICNYGFKALKGQGVTTDPIVAAIIQNDIEQMKKLIESESGRVNNLDEQGRTPLMWAAYANFKDAAAVAKNEEKRVEAVNLLIEKNADVNLVDKDGWTALMWAAWSGFPKVAGTLLASGADPERADRRGHTALMLAAMRGNAAVVRLLVENRAQTAVKNADGKTAHDLAQEMAAKYPDRKKEYDEIISLVL